ncbi:MAG TPA: hypothetical protein PK012_09630, partial [Blastocatellia bacterium]|nr:hypothetical protein [Blastocatellia bacterium]
MNRRTSFCDYRNVCCLLGLIFVGLPAMQMLLPARAQSCTFTLGSTAQNFAGGGGQGSLRVTASQPACNW